jgi:hypothetical protein
MKILNNLQKVQKSLHIETVPPLKLSAPAIYSIVKRYKRGPFWPGSPANIQLEVRNPRKIWQMKEQKSKQTGNQFPQKPIVLREFTLYFIGFHRLPCYSIGTILVFIFLFMFQVLRKTKLS